MTSQLKRFLFLAILGLALPCHSFGATINWNSEFDSTLIDSSGNLLDETFSFEVGTFGSFVPTADNMSDWESNWKVFDKAYLDDPNGWNSELRFFTRSVTHMIDGSSSSDFANPPHTTSPNLFAEGEVVYLWAYNSKSVQAGSEWALVTDGTAGMNTRDRWLIPDPNESSSINYEWHLDDANVVVFGGANDVQGAGQFSANPGSFHLQTAAVPEPNAALLVMGALGMLVWSTSRRRTRQTSAA